MLTLGRMDSGIDPVCAGRMIESEHFHCYFGGCPSNLFQVWGIFRGFQQRFQLVVEQAMLCGIVIGGGAAMLHKRSGISWKIRSKLGGIRIDCSLPTVQGGRRGVCEVCCCLYVSAARIPTLPFSIPLSTS